MLETSHVMCACLFHSWCATGHLHWLKKQAQLHMSFTWSWSMTVPDTAAALDELLTCLVEVEELLNGSAVRGLRGAMTVLMLIEQLVALEKPPHEVQGDASDIKSRVYSGGKSGETFTAFRMELPTWAGALQDNRLKVLEPSEAKEGRMSEVDVGSAGVSQEAVDDFKRVGQPIVPVTRGVHEGRGKELRFQSREIWVQGVEVNGQSHRPIVFCILEECGRTGINQANDTRICERSTMQVCRK